ncbi:MAG TPA: hypothetical protein VF159_13585, partial [Gemmatimonadaceae bacterium]
MMIASRLTFACAAVGLGALLFSPVVAWAQGEHVQRANAQAAHPSVETHDELQPAKLPPLPKG